MKKNFYTAIAIIAFLGLSNASFAQSNHPREAQVNTRFAPANDRVDNREFHGAVNAPEADRFHREDNRFNREENRRGDRQQGRFNRPEQRFSFRENRGNRDFGFRH